MRYYILSNNESKPIAVYRFNNTPEAFAQQIWLAISKKWADTDELGKYLIDGEVFLDAVSEEEAQKKFPDAFKDAEPVEPAVDGEPTPAA